MKKPFNEWATSMYIWWKAASMKSRFDEKLLRWKAAPPWCLVIKSQLLEKGNKKYFVQFQIYYIKKASALAAKLVL